VDDLEGVSDNAGSQELLSVVAAVHHDGVGQTLNDGALSLAETLSGIAASGVGDVDRGADLDVIAVKKGLACLVLDNWPFNPLEDCICAGFLLLRARVDLIEQDPQPGLRVQQFSTHVDFFDSRKNRIPQPQICSKALRTQITILAQEHRRHKEETLTSERCRGSRHPRSSTC
jgi:hypothetical protein